MNVQGENMRNIARYAVAAAVLAAALPASQAQADVITIDVSGAQGFGDLGDPLNTVRSFFLGANAHITDVAYNVNISALGFSYLSEATVYFGDSDQLGGVFLRPGFLVDAPGTDTFADSANLVDLGLDFNVGADGLLRLEFFEGFTDGELPDSIWNSGTLTFTYDGVGGAVPEPASWALMIAGVGVAGGALRRRRNVKTTVSFA
jgi:hypothetical protein